MADTAQSCAPNGNTPEIDAVYTWVDGGDEAFIESRRRCLQDYRSAVAPEAAGMQRFRNNEELRYSLRSLEAYAPWVRRIYIVTNGQVPRWLAAGNERVRIVTHDMLFSDTANLPTFNCNAIELQLHKIPGLSQRFLYFNDDCFFGRPVFPSDFITSAGGVCAYFDPTPFPSNRPRLQVHDRAYIHTQTVAGRILNGQKLSYLPAHITQLYDKKIIARLQKLLAGEYMETASHRFRAENDLVLRILYFSYLVFSDEQKGKGHEAKHLQFGTKGYSFIMLADRLWKMRLSFLAIRHRRPKFFCINDDLTGAPSDNLILKSFRFFLQSYFPRPGSFEKK